MRVTSRGVRYRRIGPKDGRGRPDLSRPAADAPGRASPPLRLVRRGPSRRRGACRGSRGGGARRPTDQRTSPVWPPRPAAACSAARSTETTTSPRWSRRPGGVANAGGGRRAGAGDDDAGNEPAGNSGNERTSVGPSPPRCARFSSASSASSARMSPIEPGDGAPAASSAAAIARASREMRITGSTPSRIVTSIRQGER